MGKIGYGYGSEWHLLRYLGYHRQALTNHISTAAGGGAVDWLDVPFSAECKPLHDDSEWKGVQAIANAVVTSGWQSYWPTTGSPPNWDAFGHITNGNIQEWLLVEAKAHVGEMASKCGASSVKSQQMIHDALENTAKRVTNKGGLTPAWHNGFYQYANRLAALNFLLNVCNPVVPARLVFIYFYGERTSKMKGCICPSSALQWQPYIDDMHKKLDINPTSPLMQKVHHVFVPINPQCDPKGLRKEIAVGTEQLERGNVTAHTSGREAAAKIKAEGRKRMTGRKQADA